MVEQPPRPEPAKEAPPCGARVQNAHEGINPVIFACVALIAVVCSLTWFYVIVREHKEFASQADIEALRCEVAELAARTKCSQPSAFNLMNQDAVEDFLREALPFIEMTMRLAVMLATGYLIINFFGGLAHKFLLMDVSTPQRAARGAPSMTPDEFTEALANAGAGEVVVARLRSSEMRGLQLACRLEDRKLAKGIKYVDGVMVARRDSY